MKRAFQITSVLFFSIFLISCGDSKVTEFRSSGKTAEMIIALNNETKWEGVIGDSIRAFFSREYEVLPQGEPLFEMAFIPIPKLTDNKMFKAHHNILIVDIDTKVSETTFEAKKDLWATPQRVIKITSPSDDAFIEYWNAKKESIYSILMDSEHERLVKTFHSFRDRDIQNEMRNIFGFTMEIPSGFYIATKRDDFMWIRKEAKHHSQGIIIYTYDFVDTMAFEKERIISFRNAMTEEFIPGPSEGSYMTLAEDYAPVLSKRIGLNGMFAVETRSLWRLEKDFMGGPFVNYTFVDERSNKVITIDCYVYAPNKPKRDLMIQMESIVHSLKFID
jgi:hypothetical protein